MIEFVQTYGLWIALAGVFVAMHWFGRGCCGGGHRQMPTQSAHGASGAKGEQESETRKSKASCH